MDKRRNIFQSDAPVAMTQLLHAVVHEYREPAQAIEPHQLSERQLEMERADGTPLPAMETPP